MTTATIDTPTRFAEGALSERLARDPAYQAFWLLRIGFTVAPIVFGIDKFANVLVNWEKYLAPWIRDLSPFSATHTMYIVGVIEVVAGVLVAAGLRRQLLHREAGAP